MKSLIVLALVLSLPLAGGCGRAGGAGQAKETSGAVDASLSPELQARQEAVRKVLVGLQTGTIVSNVSIQGRLETFLDDAGRTVRWEFDGSPKGNEVPVLLYFQDTARGKTETKAEQPVKRVYLVSSKGDRFTVARK